MPDQIENVGAQSAVPDVVLNRNETLPDDLSQSVKPQDIRMDVLPGGNFL